MLRSFLVNSTPSIGIMQSYAAQKQKASQNSSLRASNEYFKDSNFVDDIN